MYRKMKKTLKISRNTHIPFLKSKNGLLTETDKKDIRPIYQYIPFLLIINVIL